MIETHRVRYEKRIWKKRKHGIRDSFQAGGQREVKDVRVSFQTQE